MTRPSTEIKLHDCSSGQLVEAILYEGISNNNLEDFEKKWRPLLEKAKKDGKIVEDSHWKWTAKSKAYDNSLEYRLYAIECTGQTQGMMILKLVGHQSRLERGRDLAYVYLISVAPWNRPISSTAPKYKSVGSHLLAQAIGTSVDIGFEGRIGLHSLPGSASYYKAIGMISGGHDPACESLEYFEMSKQMASTFLKRMRA